MKKPLKSFWCNSIENGEEFGDEFGDDSILYCCNLSGSKVLIRLENALSTVNCSEVRRKRQEESEECPGPWNPGAERPHLAD